MRKFLFYFNPVALFAMGVYAFLAFSPRGIGLLGDNLLANFLSPITGAMTLFALASLAGRFATVEGIDPHWYVWPKVIATASSIVSVFSFLIFILNKEDKYAAILVVCDVALAVALISAATGVFINSALEPTPEGVFRLPRFKLRFRN